MAPCQSDSFSLQAPMFRTQVKATVFNLGLSDSSATASDASTYLQKNSDTQHVLVLQFPFCPALSYLSADMCEPVYSHYF